MIITVKDTFGAKITTLWDDPRFKTIDFLRRGFFLDEVINIGSILFIGINPSFNDKTGIAERIFYNNRDHPYFHKFPKLAIEIIGPTLT